MCGIIGIHGSPQAAQEVFQGLLLLQHRGQDAAGILSFQKSTQQFHLHKDRGLVSQVFDEKKILNLEGETAIGHSRYATLASKQNQGQRDLQPMVVNSSNGLGVAHNGNIVNLDEVSQLLRQKYHRVMLTKNDAEALVNLIAVQLGETQAQSQVAQMREAADKVFTEAQGGYALVGVWGNGMMFGLRDPHGIRPLVLGRKTSPTGSVIYILCSESNVLGFLGYEFLRDVQPGELILINEQGTFLSSESCAKKDKAPCMFEWIYFATPESVMDGTPVYEARLRLGKKLGDKVQKLIQTQSISPDIVVPVPESGRIAAIALSESIGVPYREVLIKNRYIQRSFILQDQESRKRAVQLKLMAVTSEIKGKNVLLVDDSIVRGTTSRRLIETVREAGAKEVYLVSTCPPIKYPCYFGIDFPLRNELIASKLSEDEVATKIGADRVIYQDLENLSEALMQKNLCRGCLTGQYPVDISRAAESFRKEREQNASSL